MHELSIALNLLDIATEESERRGQAVVRTIYIRLGPLSGVVPHALESAYELAREQSPFPDSRLVIEETVLTGYCDRCGQQCRIGSIQLLCCEQCGAAVSQLLSGRELEVTAMEIEMPDDIADDESALTSEVSRGSTNPTG